MVSNYNNSCVIVIQKRTTFRKSNISCFLRKKWFKKFVHVHDFERKNVIFHVHVHLFILFLAWTMNTSVCSSKMAWTCSLALFIWWTQMNVLCYRMAFKFAERSKTPYHQAIPQASEFYKSWSGYKDELCWGAAWLYAVKKSKI